MLQFSPLDMIALALFVGTWTGYALAVEVSVRGRGTLNARMNRFREVWMRRMLARDMRMVDMQIMASLQNGTAFFASTSLIAIGGALSLLRSTDEILAVMGALPLSIPTSRVPPEAEAHIRRTARLFATAGRHFNRGQRAFFLALGYLGWYAGPYVLIATTAAVIIVLWRRQFASDSRQAVIGD